MIKEHKYEYLLKVWGGFWNQHNIDIHKESYIPYKWFNTKEERQLEINRLDSIQEQYKFKDGIIARTFSEGYLTRYEVVIESVIEFKGKQYKIENNCGFGFANDDLDILGNGLEYMKEFKYDIDIYRTLPHLEEDEDFKVNRLFTTVILR